MSGGESRSQRLALLLIGIIVILLWIVSGGETAKTAIVKPSTFLYGDGGARGLFLVLDEMGGEPTPWMRPLTKIDAEPRSGVLAILAPEERIASDEAGALLDWIETGGHVLYVPAAGRDDDRLLAAFGLSAGRSLETHSSVQRRSAISDLGARLLEEAPSELGGFSATLKLPDPPPEDVEPLYAIRADDASGSVGVLLVRRGEGAALIVTDAGPLTNGELAKSEAARFVISALTTLRGDGPIRFDEFHHGFDEEGGVVHSTWRWLTHAPLGHALFGLALVVLLAVGCAGLRFGAIVPPPPLPPRSALSHVEALANGWLRGRAKKRPRELLLEGLRLRLLGRDESATLAALAANEPALAASVAQIEAARAAKVDADPLALADAVDRVLAKLKPTMTRTETTVGKERTRG